MTINDALVGMITAPLYSAIVLVSTLPAWGVVVFCLWIGMAVDGGGDRFLLWVGKALLGIMVASMLLPWAVYLSEFGR